MTGRTGKLISINTSGGGVPKQPVLEATVSELGVADDAHTDWNHGGLNRAICIYSLELIKMLRAEGHPIDIGTAGENFTVEGVDWSPMVPGLRVGVGPQVRLEITSFTTPCKTIAWSFTGGRFTRISQKLFPGWSRVYARVTAPGQVETGSSIVIE